VIQKRVSYLRIPIRDKIVQDRSDETRHFLKGRHGAEDSELAEIYHCGTMCNRVRETNQEQPMKALIGILVVLSATSIADAADWKLVWSDEFDKPGSPDTAKWNYETGFAFNHEKQYYTVRSENARIENGVLVIEGRKEKYNTSAADPKGQSNPLAGASKGQTTADYTSARLTTRGKAAWTYGRIEVRAKLPEARGTWPAIWTLGTNIDKVGWPTCGEIDIMEFVGLEPGVVHANIHTKKYNHVMKTGKGDQLSIADCSHKFHVYSAEWDAEKIDFFVDARKYFTFRNERTGADTWPYDHDQYLILNLAIGGDWGGQKGIDDQSFPQRFEIDYVRVYQKPSAKP
jgi:beta-glucanase (GH16 family)